VDKSSKIFLRRDNFQAGIDRYQPKRFAQFLAVSMGCNLCRPSEKYVHVGFRRRVGRTRPAAPHVGCGRFACDLLVSGFGTFVEALDNPAELHWRYVRSCRTRCAGEGERVL
jgi:hypothetical protein